MEGWFQLFETSAIDGGEWSASSAGQFSNVLSIRFVCTRLEGLLCCLFAIVPAIEI